jgi:hypothetical protein
MSRIGSPGSAAFRSMPATGRSVEGEKSVVMGDHRRRFALDGQRHRLVERQIAGDAASRERFRASIDGQEEQIRSHATVFFTLPCERDRVSGMDD